jgi:hypothetical protein
MRVPEDLIRAAVNLLLGFRRPRELERPLSVESVERSSIARFDLVCAGDVHVEVLDLAVADPIDPAMDREWLTASPRIANDRRPGSSFIEFV